MQTDAGDITCQNITGNTVERDISKYCRDHEFEGALAVLRFWYPEAEASGFEMHGKVSEPNPKEDEFKFRILDLFDTSGIASPQYYYQSSCFWRFKSAQCGSTGSATSCPKDFASCQDATRAAQERFPAILTPPPQALNNFTGLPGPGSGGGGDDGRGKCFTPDTLVKTQRGDVRFDELRESDWVLTIKGWRPIEFIRVHEFAGQLQRMPAGWGVTAQHEILRGIDWTRAEHVWAETFYYEGKLYNLEVLTDEPHKGKNRPDTEHSFTLADGTIAHNQLAVEKLT